MESPQILVTGLPDGTTKYDLIIYFQSKRDSGGSDVKEVSEIERGQAIIIFNDAEVASKVSRKAEHYILGSKVTVILLPVMEGTDLKRDSSRDDRSEESEHHGAINNRFGIEQSDHNNKIQGADASASPPSHDRTASKILQNRKSPLKQCTVKVKDLPAEADKETLLHYFENAKRSNGGPVSQISDINRELQTCLITFENPDDAARTVEHSPHHLGSFRLELSLLETELEDDVPIAFGESKRKFSTDETEVIITASGICLPPEEDLRDYFENQRRSGGGKVLSIDYTDDGDAVVTFAEVKDLKRLLKPDSHSYDGNPITVVRQPPRKKVPLDPVRVLVQGLKAGVIIKPDNVRNYLEKFCDVYVTDVHFGCNNNALVVFDAEPDFAALFHKVSKDTIGLKGSKPELERVPLCTCMHVTGLMKETPELTIELYFDNEKRSGGSNVISVEKIGENEALVYFEDSASITNVINQGKNHTLGNLTLEVKPYYPFIENTARNKSEITCDPRLFDYIKEDHGSEFQALLDENEMELFLEFDTPIVTVSSNAKKKVSYNSWQEKMGSLESFLQGFMKKPVQIPSEIFDEVVNRWENRPSIAVSFDDDRRLAHIIGKSKQVENETNRLQELIREIKEDTDLMESITKVDIPGIPKSRLTLLQMSGICEKLESEHQHLKISFEENGQRLCLKGPRILHNEVKVKVLAFTSKVIEQAVPLSTNKIKVLKKDTVFDYLHSLLKQRSIQALFVYDQSKTSSSNEVEVVGDGPRSVEEATVVLQNEIQERSLHLTKENAVVLECRSWTDFHSEVTSNFKVEMFTESPSSTVCVIGIAEDVKECFEQVKHFLDANTILRNSLPLDQGTTRFIIQKWGSKLARIKTALVTCLVEIKPATNYDGIEVSGTAEGLEKCLPRLQELVKAVQKDSVSVERQGIKKYILHEKGPEELKSIEDNNQCIIVVKESKNSETSLTAAGAEGFSGMLSSKSLSSYSLEEEEKGSMLDDADAIVNPDHTETGTLLMDIKKPKLAAFNTGATPHTTPMKATLRSSPSIRITVKVGDLSKEKADILVGTAASSLNLEQNPCARALKNAAGPSLQQECTKKGRVRSGDIAVINQTGSPQWGLQCQTVIFAICPPWNGGQGKEALKSLLTKCLEEADLKNMTSIAFAAIGTGNLQFPRDQVAEIYFDEVNSYNQKHPSTSLKDVRFVLHDTPTTQAFQAAERAKQNSGPSGAVGNGASLDGSTTFSPVRERTPDHLETTVGPLSFQAQQGSITNETTEAIAIISNSELDISASGTGAAILKEGGSAIATECSKHAPRIPGSVFVSTAGNLKAGHLYHIVPRKFPLTPDSLQDSVLKCLQEAEVRGLSSITFPAIGTGNLGITAKDCTRAVLTAIHELSTQKPKSLKLVKMTIFQKSMIKDVRSAMNEASGMKPLEETGAVRKIFEKGLKKVAGIVSIFGGKEERPPAPTTNRELDNKKVDLVIFAGCESDLQKALKAVNEMMAENSKQQRIKEETIKSLTEDDMRIIHTLELKYSVEMNVKKEVGCIVIDGLSDDIRQVVGEVHEMLHRVEKRCHAEMISKDIQWKRKTKGKFEEYESHLNAEIEFAFHQSKPYVIIRRDEEKYKIVFDGWTEHDEYGNITEVRRIDLRKDVEFPVEWAPQPTDPQTGREETVYVYQLDPIKDAQEYKRVSDNFRQSCANNIMKIERVQNPTLYGTYAINKQKMDKAKVRGSNEMCLFHGTKGPNCEPINHKGFNRSFCGENAVHFGNGVYFAAKASYSAKSKYSPPDDKGNRYMYVARVLVGEYTVGKEGMMVPPAKNSNNLTDTYDTVVNNVSDPSIYVVFYDWQCYPEYLITFQ